MGANFFGAAQQFFLKKIAHYLSMSTKRKAQQSTFDDDLSSKAGRPLKSYTVDDAVKMVRFNARVLSEIAIVMRILVASHVEILLRNFTCATNNLYCYFFRRL